MDEKTRRPLAGSLGDPERDFKEDPLTQSEIEAIVFTYSEELKREDIDPEVREIYTQCVNFLKDHLVFH